MATLQRRTGAGSLLGLRTALVAVGLSVLGETRSAEVYADWLFLCLRGVACALFYV